MVHKKKWPPSCHREPESPKSPKNIEDDVISCACAVHWLGMRSSWRPNPAHTTCNYVVSVWRGFLFLWVLGMGYVILLWHSLSLPYNYFDYQKGKSTTDCIFLLHSIISKVLSNRQKLYAIFIEYEKCLDKINHMLLWQKLIS